MKNPLHAVGGALDIMGRRAREVGQVGLTLWTSVGGKALKQHRDELVAKAADAELDDAAAEQLLLKAKEGGLDNSDLPLINRALQKIRKSRDADREIGQIAR